MKVPLLLSVLAGLCLAFVTGCSTTTPGATITLPMLPPWREPSDPSRVSGAEVFDGVVRLAPLATLQTSDNTFTRLNAAYASELIAWTRSFVWAEQSTQRAGLSYTPESFDCDKFAKAFTLAAEVAAARAKIHAQPLAFRIYVHQLAAFGGVPAGGNHALVALVTDAGVLIVEPQTGQTAPLESYPNRAEIYRVTVGG